jgi:MFS family permease
MVFPALRSHNLRLFLVGQGISLLGNAMQQVALAWLVYRASHSSVVLGVVAFAAGIPAAVVTPLAGTIADRANLQRILIATQALAASQAFALAFVLYIGEADIGLIIALVFVSGIVSGIETPMQPITLSRLVAGKEVLTSAIGLNATCYDAARILGPALGGLLLVRYSEALVFFTNGLLHLSALVLFSFLRLEPVVSVARQERISAALLEGLRYAFNLRAILAILLLSASVSFSGSAYMVLLPVMAERELNGGPHVLGLLTGAIGVGAIAGGLLLSMRNGNAKLIELICLGASLFGFGMLGFSVSHVLGYSVLAMSVIGIGVMMIMACCSTLLLVITDASVQGRVIGLYTLSFLGIAPIGSLCTGFLAKWLSAPTTIAASGIVCLIAALLFFLYTRPLKLALLRGGSHIS